MDLPIESCPDCSSANPFRHHCPVSRQSGSYDPSGAKFRVARYSDGIPQFRSKEIGGSGEDLYHFFELAM